VRRIAAIVVASVVAASCIPSVRHQHFFSVLVETTAVALVGFIIFGGVRALFTWSKQRRQQADLTQSRWRSLRFRNLSIGAALILALMLFLPHFMATSSGAYKLAVATAHQSAEFNELLGTPVSEGWFSESKIEVGNPATADLLIPVRERLRSGNLRAFVVKDDGGWRLKDLTLELAHPREPIDLLADSR
jgi:hypothetical protein